MAVVVWVYAGGGHSEAEALTPFLQKNLVGSFERRLPRRLPGPRPGVPVYPGSTGKTLASEIRDNIRDHWTGAAGAILVVDDTDANEPESHLAMLRRAVEEGLSARGINATDAGFPVIIALAVPELETWPIADWDHTFRVVYGNCHAAVRHELATHWGMNLEDPESFSVHDEHGSYRKLSEVIREVIRLKCANSVPYSKATQTPRLLMLANPAVISHKCPYFRRAWSELTKHCPVA